MSLLKLLSVGRSFAGAGPEPGRYKMLPHYRLPQFGASKSDEPSGVDVAAARQAKPVRLDSETFLRRFLKRVRGGRGEAREISIFRPRGNGEWQILQRAARASEKGKPRFGALFSRAPERPAEQRMEQIELGLDQVRVVRNDLSEADLQVVPRPRRPSERTQKRDLPPAPVQVGNTEAGSRMIWNRMTARLFVAGRARLE
jgi:hypothetical protein